MQLRLHHVVLCGAIVPYSFRWELYTQNISGSVVNDRGARDIWPAMAQACCWGYGATGTLGASQSRVKDRLHDVDHGGFFTPDFVQTYWLPLFRDGKIVYSEGTPRTPGWMGVLSRLPLRWVLAVGMIVALLVAAMWLWRNALELISATL